MGSKHLPSLSGWFAAAAGEEQRALMARALMLLFVSGTILAGCSLFATSLIDDAERIAILAILLGAVAICAVIGFAWRRLPEQAFPILLAAGTLIASAGTYVVSELPADAEMFYIWVALFAAYFFTPAQTVLQIAFVGVCYAAVLASDASTGNELGRWLITIGTLAAAALIFTRVSAELRRRLDARERSELELERSVSMLESTLESTADGILVVDNQGAIASLNRTFQRMWGIPDEVVAARDDEAALACASGQLIDPDQFLRKVRQLYDQPEAQSFDVLEFKDGRTFERLSKPQRGRDGCIHGRVWSFRDVTERQRTQTRLRQLAERDALTGLLNRRRFEELLGGHLDDRRRAGAGAVLMLDLDDFKEINDSLGHHTGDELLAGIADLLRAHLREGDVLARLGGDEFAILLPSAAVEQARQVAEHLLDHVRRHRTVSRGRGVRVTTSIGIAAVGERAGGETEEVLVEADVALYAAKDGGRDRVAVYTGDRRLSDQPGSGLRWSERIRTALDEERFVLYAQPILDLREGRISQYELLLRMRDGSGGLLPPGSFLPGAERSGLIAEIDAWVTRRAIELLAHAEREGLACPLAVNLSGRSVNDSTLPAMVEHELEAHAVDPRNLIFEVTETAAAVNLEEARTFASKLAQLGCRFALDDFGAGFGSFYYLKYLLLDYLKIDGDFIGDLGNSSTDQAVVLAIVELSRQLGMQTIAEFVGNQQTVELLRAYGVDFAQGRHVGEPLPVADALAASATARLMPVAPDG